MTILVSIASYRDPELMPTIRDCINQACYPDALCFGICWQHGDDEAVPADFGDRRFRVISVPWRESKGACWARAEIMKLWDGEDFFLQIDSHHRFVPGWDAILLSQMERSSAEKPVLSTYVQGYDPGTGVRGPADPMQMDFDRFTEDGIVVFRSRAIPEGARSGRPLRARFVSGHFLFAPGTFAVEVPYDPSLYFIGEEITLSIRAFTHGYTLLHPSEHVLWHEYSRAYRTKHWDDHVAGVGVEQMWHTRDAASREKVRRFLSDPEIGSFGCGTARSFAEYEAYAGLNFRRRIARPQAQQGMEPPPAPVPLAGSAALRPWEVRIVLDRAALPPAALADPHFWYVGFHDANDAEIHREDAAERELRDLRRPVRQRPLRCRKPMRRRHHPLRRLRGAIGGNSGNPRSRHQPPRQHRLRPRSQARRRHRLLCPRNL
jgi:hypothetical protein